MYHYVRAHSPSHPNFRYLDIENFRKQLDYFERKYGFVSIDDWKKNVLSQTSANTLPRGVVLTFDDATSCHYEYVTRELKSRKLWGIFYIPTGPYSTGRVLDVHRIHLLCGAFDGERLLRLCSEIVTEEMIPFKKREEFTKATYVRYEDYSGVREFKRLLNYFIAEEFRSSTLEEIAKCLNFKFPGVEFYASQENIKGMEDDGMIIGSHSVSHPVMSKLNLEQQIEEISNSFNFLESFCRLDHRTYCHPYGGTKSYNRETVMALEQCKVDYSFSIESRDLENSDFSKIRQALPRYDCNEYPHGSAS